MSFRSREAWFRDLARLAPVAMFLTDVAGEEILVNERWCGITGLSEKDAQGMGWLRSVHPEERERIKREVNRAIAEVRGYSLEHRLLGAGGETTWAISKVAPVLDSRGLPEGYIGVMMDVGSKEDIAYHLIEVTRKLGEDIRSRMHAISNLQHELRTPLTGIIGLSELLRDEVSHAEHSLYIRMIHESSMRLKETIDRILQLSHVESSAGRPELKNTDLSRVVQTVALRFAFSARRKGLEMAVDIREQGPEVLVDAGMLKQALSHVLDNALKFTPRGTVTISLRDVVNERGKFAEISIIDTGLGIPKEHQQSVFEPFRQVSEGPAREYEGIGLGLTVAKILVEEMNGSISLQSEPSNGTSVFIRFPVIPDA